MGWFLSNFWRITRVVSRKAVVVVGKPNWRIRAIMTSLASLTTWLVGKIVSSNSKEIKPSFLGDEAISSGKDVANCREGRCCCCCCWGDNAPTVVAIVNAWHPWWFLQDPKRQHPSKEHYHFEQIWMLLRFPLLKRRSLFWHFLPIASCSLLFGISCKLQRKVDRPHAFVRNCPWHK